MRSPIASGGFFSCKVIVIPIAALATSCGGEPAPSDLAGSPDGGQPACGVWRLGPTLMNRHESSPTFLVEGGLVLAVSGHFDNRTGGAFASEIYTACD